jgi:hypothetical protein
MTVLTILEFSGATEELYERVGARLADRGAPDGITHHACGPVADGWRILGVWESQETFDRFVDNLYIPAMLAEGGTRPSRREVWPAHHAGAVIR